MDLYIQPLDKSVPAKLLYTSDSPKVPDSWSADDKFLAFEQGSPGRGWGVWIYDSETRNAKPFRDEPFNEDYPQFSPDSRWLAYQFDDLGGFEFYVAPFPGPGPTCKISSSGGEEAHWSVDGKELFYRQGITAMVTNVADRNFCNAHPHPPFVGFVPLSWDVWPKGAF